MPAERRRASFLSEYFYFWMSLLIVAIVIYGFSATAGKVLLHPAVPRPHLLYVHAAVFSAWLVVLVFQSALIRLGKTQVHRLTGWFGAVLGAAIPPVGVATAITMGRFNAQQLHARNPEAGLIIPLFDMVAFTITFALAIYWRKKPEYHRRLILVATCALTAAAFGRFRVSLLPPILFYADVDILILLGAARDWLVERKVHPVYRYALPGFVLGQAIATYTAIHNSPFWFKIAHALLG